MISFRLNELPAGVSEETLSVDASDLDLEDTEITRVNIVLRFNKQEENIRIGCRISAHARLTCDRSLEVYEDKLESRYEVVYQSKVTEEREDLSAILKVLEPSKNVMDITREIRDSVLLSIPVKKLHPRFYSDGAITDFFVRYGSDDENKQDNDPRWDALKRIKQKMQNN